MIKTYIPTLHTNLLTNIMVIGHWIQILTKVATNNANYKKKTSN